MGPAPHPVNDKGQLAPPFVEWMMGFPAGWTDHLSRRKALEVLGNAVVVQVGETVGCIAGKSGFPPQRTGSSASNQRGV